MASQRRMRPQRLRGVTGGDVPNPFALFERLFR
jgi:hypothetical protein